MISLDYLCGLMEPDFVNPVFRMMFNQNPYNVRVVCLTRQAHNSNRDFVRALKNVSEPTVLVTKDKNGNLIETVFIPVSKGDETFDFSSIPFDKTVASLLSPVISQTI